MTHPHPTSQPQVVFDGPQPQPLQAGVDEKQHKCVAGVGLGGGGNSTLGSHIVCVTDRAKEEQLRKAKAAEAAGDRDVAYKHYKVATM